MAVPALTGDCRGNKAEQLSLNVLPLASFAVFGLEGSHDNKAAQCAATAQ